MLKPSWGEGGTEKEVSQNPLSWQLGHLGAEWRDDGQKRSLPRAQCTLSLTLLSAYSTKSEHSAHSSHTRLLQQASHSAFSPYTWEAARQTGKKPGMWVADRGLNSVPAPAPDKYITVCKRCKPSRPPFPCLLSERILFPDV